ncbi:MAG: hypothetical protein H7A53_06525 [Akkermansiaceae bacterium]|nr:hypothetical protein [Akkermansiaceae bacterium]
MTIFVGDNAQGKTSILEAVCVLLRLQSPRTSSLAEAIQMEKNGFAVGGSLGDTELLLVSGKSGRRFRSTANGDAPPTTCAPANWSCGWRTTISRSCAAGATGGGATSISWRRSCSPATARPSCSRSAPCAHPAETRRLPRGPDRRLHAFVSLSTARS